MKIRTRCNDCLGLGYTSDYGADGWTRTTCPKCTNGVVEVDAPTRSKLRGVATGKLVLDARDGLREHFQHASLVLYGPKRAEDDDHGAVVFEITFQQHSLQSVDDARLASLPDPRFDVGQVPFSSWYAPHINGRNGSGFHLDTPEALMRAARCAKRLHEAQRRLAHGYTCMLASVVDALALLGVPVEIRYAYGRSELLTCEACRERGVSMGVSQAAIDAHRPKESAA